LNIGFLPTFNSSRVYGGHARWAGSHHKSLLLPIITPNWKVKIKILELPDEKKIKSVTSYSSEIKIIVSYSSEIKIIVSYSLEIKMLFCYSLEIKLYGFLKICNPPLF
jgi:hypothetical protein